MAAFDKHHLVTGGEDNLVLVFSLDNSEKRRLAREKLLEVEKYSVKYNVYVEMVSAKVVKKKKQGASSAPSAPAGSSSSPGPARSRN